MIVTYPACFFKEDEGYSVFFPDLPGCQTCAYSLDEALEMAMDALALYLDTLREEGREVPPPTPLERVDPDETARALELEEPFEKTLAANVTIDLDEYLRLYGDTGFVRCKLPHELIDRAFDAELDFSEILREALEAKLSSV